MNPTSEGQTEPPRVEMVADYRCHTGEGPLWHEKEQRLYWVDIPPGRIFRYDPATGKHEQVLESPTIGGFTFQEDGGLLLFMDKGAIRCWKDGQFTTLYEDLPKEGEARFNDVISDPRGRVFCGTMHHSGGKGRLYRLDTDGSIEEVLDGIAISNGMGFTPDRKQMYYIDSLAYRIYLFDYDVATGAITNQRDFVRIPKELGLPDGMTVDSEGFVWTAIYGGGCVVRFDPDGTEERRLAIPTAKNITSVIFGGPSYADLFITTAGGPERPQSGEQAGGLFRAQPGIRGVPEFRSNVRCAG